MKRDLNVLVVAVGVLTLIPAGLWAQRSTRPGEVELSFHGGATFDLPGAPSYVGIVESRNPNNRSQQFLPGRKSQPLIGGGAAVALYKVLWVYGDYSYVFPDRTAASTVFGSSTGVNTVNRHYWMMDGGFQLTFPTVQRVMPYISVGAGKLHQNYSSTRRYTNVTGVPLTYNRQVFNSFTPHLGAGVRVFLTERSGFRFSVDGYYSNRPLEALVQGVGDTYPTVARKGFGRVAGGYFVRFGRR